MLREYDDDYKKKGSHLKTDCSCCYIFLTLNQSLL